MSGLLYASAAVLVLLAGLAAVVYFRAVAHGLRAYFHVVLASILIIGLEVGYILDWPGLVLIANCSGIGAMIALALRFRDGGEEEASGERMVPFRSALVGYSILLIAVVAGIARSETLATDARENIIRSQREGCARDNETLAALRENIDQQIQRTRATPPDLIPGVDRETFDVLIERALMDLRDQRASMEQRDCDALHPQP